MDRFLVSVDDGVISASGIERAKDATAARMGATVAALQIAADHLIDGVPSVTCHCVVEDGDGLQTASFRIDINVSET